MVSPTQGKTLPVLLNFPSVLMGELFACEYVERRGTLQAAPSVDIIVRRFIDLGCVI